MSQGLLVKMKAPTDFSLYINQVFTNVESNKEVKDFSFVELIDIL